MIALAAAMFLCPVASVYDGDTLTCLDGARVRLAAVDAPEIRKCREGRICAPGDPKRSKARLEKLTLGRTLVCSPTGKSWGRIVAYCSVMGPDLSCSLYRGRYAVRVPEFDRDRRLCGVTK